MNAPFIYYFDSYAYVSKAVDFASQGTVQLGIGTPFVLTLAALLFAFESSFGLMLVVRVLMLLMSAVTVCVIYLLGTRMVSKTFGFLAALLAIFEPYFLTYSIVPHNDVFVIAIGLTALYLATSNLRFGYALGPVFFYIAILTRPEFFVVLVIPILTFSLAKTLKFQSKKSLAKLVFVAGVYTLPSIWIYVISRTYTRFNIFEKLGLFLTPELLQFTLGSIFKFYSEALLNQIFFVFVAVGVGLSLLTIADQFVSFERTGNSFSIKRKRDKYILKMFLSDKALITLCVFLLFLIHVIVLTVYGIGYVIVDGTVLINTWIPDRYMILSKLLISYPLAYALAIVVQGVRGQIVRQK